MWYVNEINVEKVEKDPVHQVKLFKGLESEITGLEKQVNTWLAESGAKILHIFGNISPQSCPVDEKGGVLTKGSFLPSDILLVIHYEA